MISLGGEGAAVGVGEVGAAGVGGADEVGVEVGGVGRLGAEAVDRGLGSLGGRAGGREYRLASA